MIFDSYLQDPRIMQTVAVVLGIDADAPDTEGKYHKKMCCYIIFYLNSHIIA